MIGRRKRLAFLLCLAFFVASAVCIGCDLAWEKDSSTGKKDPQPPSDPLFSRMSHMTLDEKIGQMVTIGIDGTELDENAKEFIRASHVGGVILFKNNLKNVSQMLRLLNSLKETNASNGIPLFLSVDQEGGRVDRMPEELAKTPSARAIGETNNSKLAFEIGIAVAGEIRSLGFNLDFAPVLDINSNPHNPVIGDRSFGSDADLVGSLGTQMMKGIASKNVIPVIKHFPGHGDTSVDSHTGLPLVNNGLDRLRSFELLPFRQAIQAGADAVMIAHILFPQIDPQNPASLSPFFITDLLRNELGFQGVVFTDDLTMGAIVEHYDIGEAAVSAVKAGANVVLVCHGYDKEDQVIQALKQAALDGSISAETIDRSVYQILSLKQKYKLSDEKIDSVDAGDINAVIKRVLDEGTP